ncbi:MAG: hypothetical protein KatS3mg129_0949 [Leptospiraceae bacterium]|nr:MAG: hypothetical protein KatS3mg129_0949 [Leptospiraceae bacterium]
MISLSEDLNKRINPEKSRHFNTDFYENHLLILDKIYKEIKKLFSINPIRISIVWYQWKRFYRLFFISTFFS